MPLSDGLRSARNNITIIVRRPIERTAPVCRRRRCRRTIAERSAHLSSTPLVAVVVGARPVVLGPLPIQIQYHYYHYYYYIIID